MLLWFSPPNLCFCRCRTPVEHLVGGQCGYPVPDEDCSVEYGQVVGVVGRIHGELAVVVVVVVVVVVDPW